MRKPAHLPTTSPSGSDGVAAPCLTGLVPALDPDAPRLHPSSRLDAEVTGLVTFARTRDATKALLDLRARGRYHRRYLALCVDGLRERAGTCALPVALHPDDKRKRVAVREGRGRGQRDARTDFEVLDQHAGVALVAFVPQTGRTHQIRVHAAALGAPILGDVHYGGPRRLTLGNGRVVTARRVLLHCARLHLDFDVDPVTVVDPPPDDLQRVWCSLGGERVEGDGLA